MLESDVQRRLTAIVAVDLAGFSRRAEVDEADAVRQVGKLAARVSEAAKRHGGRVFNTAGDGFMLEFPTVSGALEAADALAASGDVRIGVHLGEVTVAPDGDLLGHGVNVAARLQALAKPGCVVVSGDAQRAVRGRLAARLVAKGRVRLDKMKEASPVFVLALAEGSPRKTAGLRRRRPSGRTVAILSLAGLMVAVAAGAAWWSGRREGPLPVQARIAVLPFEALSDRREGQALAKGVADQIATTLSANNIAVISNDDAAGLRGVDRGRHADALGAALVLDGEVQDFGDTLEIRVRLDDPTRRAVLWTADVKGPQAEAARVQAHVAKLVVNTLGCSGRALAAPDGLSDPVLLARYLHACDIFVNAHFTPQKIYELFDALREVTAKAPRFAPAHSDLAKFSGYFVASLPPSETAGLRAQGLAEAKAALALDPKSPDARLAQEFLLPPTAWAEREALLRNAVADTPAWPHTNGFLGMLLLDTGRAEDGLPYMQRAAAADLQVDWKPVAALFQVCSGPSQGALSDLRQELTTEGDNATARSFLTGALICAAEWKEAREVVRAGYAEGVTPRSRFETMQAFLTAMITRSTADLAEARRVLLLHANETDSQTALAVQYLAALGFMDDAFRVADRYRAGGPNSGARTNFLFLTVADPLRRDRRFIGLADRLKLVDYWRTSGRWPDFCSQPNLPYDCRAEAAKLR